MSSLKVHVYFVTLIAAMAMIGCAQQKPSYKTIDSGDSWLTEFDHESACRSMFDEPAAHITFQVPAVFRLAKASGRILPKNSDRWLDEGVTLNLRSLSREHEFILTSSLSGEFDFEGLPEGKYCIQTFISGWQSAIIQLDVRDSNTETLDLRLPLDD